jgi:hypothetical protein
MPPRGVSILPFFRKNPYTDVFASQKRADKRSHNSTKHPAEGKSAYTGSQCRDKFEAGYNDPYDPLNHPKWKKQ